MDGYAVRPADVSAPTSSTRRSSPSTSEVAAGDTGQRDGARPRACARIMTGAPVPPGADAVVPVEWTDGGGAARCASAARRPGPAIRRSGEDVRGGQVVLTAGTHLGAPQIGLLAAIGRDLVAVRPAPRVVVLSTGDELVEPGAAAGPREDPGLEQLHAGDRGAGGRRRGLPASASCRTTARRCWTRSRTS